MVRSSQQEGKRNALPGATIRLWWYLLPSETVKLCSYLERFSLAVQLRQEGLNPIALPVAQHRYRPRLVRSE